MIKHYIKKILICIIPIVNHIPIFNSIRMQGNNKLSINSTILWHCKIRCRGNNNSIIFRRGGVLKNCKIEISGDDNIIEIGEGVIINQGDLYIEDDNNVICLGNHTSLTGRVHLACTEGSKVIIGDDCLFSSEIVFRTGDSHSILDQNGKRINSAKDITIGNHVWLGHRVLINKGVYIGANSIVGTGSVVTKVFNEGNIVLAGVPAEIKKKNVNWCDKRI